MAAVAFQNPLLKSSQQNGLARILESGTRGGHTDLPVICGCWDFSTTNCHVVLGHILRLLKPGMHLRNPFVGHMAQPIHHGCKATYHNACHLAGWPVPRCQKASRGFRQHDIICTPCQSLLSAAMVMWLTTCPDDNQHQPLRLRIAWKPSLHQSSLTRPAVLRHKLAAELRHFEDETVWTRSLQATVVCTSWQLDDSCWHM